MFSLSPPGAIHKYRSPKTLNDPWINYTKKLEYFLNIGDQFISQYY